jgi:6-phosphofructokinase 1
MICLVGGRIRSVPFEEITDPKTGRTRVRLVDIYSESYRVAMEYMIRLKVEDFEDPERVERLAGAAKMDREDFRMQFEKVVGFGPMAFAEIWR